METWEILVNIMAFFSLLCISLGFMVFVIFICYDMYKERQRWY